MTANLLAIPTVNQSESLFKPYRAPEGHWKSGCVGLARHTARVAGLALRALPAACAGLLFGPPKPKLVIRLPSSHPVG